jgi:hypothetical protein
MYLAQLRIVNVRKKGRTRQSKGAYSTIDHEIVFNGVIGEERGA